MSLNCTVCPALAVFHYYMSNETSLYQCPVEFIYFMLRIKVQYFESCCPSSLNNPSPLMP